MKNHNQNKQLTFVQEGTTWFGIVNDAVFEGRLHDELLYCEIEEGGLLRWEDSYHLKYAYTTTDVAKSAASKEYFKHKPYSNGRNYEC